MGTAVSWLWNAPPGQRRILWCMMILRCGTLPTREPGRSGAEVSRRTRQSTITTAAGGRLEARRSHGRGHGRARQGRRRSGVNRGKIPAVSGDRGYLPLNRGFWVGLRRRTWAQSVSAGEPELSGPGSRFMILGGEMSTTCARRFPQVIHNSVGGSIVCHLHLQSYPQFHIPYNTNNRICLLWKGILAFDDHRRYSS